MPLCSSLRFSSVMSSFNYSNNSLTARFQAIFLLCHRWGACTSSHQLQQVLLGTNRDSICWYTILQVPRSELVLLPSFVLVQVQIVRNISLSSWCIALLEQLIMASFSQRLPFLFMPYTLFMFCLSVVIIDILTAVIKKIAALDRSN